MRGLNDPLTPKFRRSVQPPAANLAPSTAQISKNEETRAHKDPGFFHILFHFSKRRLRRSASVARTTQQAPQAKSLRGD